MSDAPAPSAAPASAPAPSSSSSPAQSGNPPDREVSGSDSSTSGQKLPGQGQNPSDRENSPPEKRKFKIKVHGKEQELELSDAEIALRLQKDEAAEVRMQKAAEIEKQRAAEWEALKKDPFKFLTENLKLEDLDARMEDRLAEKYRQEAMSEEERKQFEITKELERYRQQEKERQEKEVQAARQAEVDRAYQEKERLYTEALKKLGVPGDMEMLAMMAQVDMLNLDHDLELNPDQLAAEVKARLDKPSAQYKAKLEKLEGEDLLKELGQAAVDKVLKASLARLNSKAATKALDPEPKVPAKYQDEEEPQRNSGGRASKSDAFWRNLTWGND